jgi:hypothetical protein
VVVALDVIDKGGCGRGAVDTLAGGWRHGAPGELAEELVGMSDFGRIIYCRGTGFQIQSAIDMG